MVNIKTALTFFAFGIALMGFVPLFPYLDAAPRILFIGGLAGGALMEYKGGCVKSWFTTALAIIFFMVYAIKFTAHDVVGPAVNLLVILLAVRVCSEKNPRNYLQIYALSLFCLAASSLFSLSPLFLCYFLLMLMMIAVSLVVLTYHTSTSAEIVPRARLKTVLKVALVIPAASVPLIVVFFFILPRTQFPLWNFLNKGVKVTGLAEKVSPGMSSSVAEVKNVVFRATAPRLPAEQLYWRGMVYNVFEENAWIRRKPPAGESGMPGKGEVVRQTIFPAPGRARILLALNIPRQVSGIRSAGSPDFTYVRTAMHSRHEKYEAVSVLSGRIEARSGVDSDFYLNIPPHLSPRLVRAGTEVARRAHDEPEKLKLLKDFFVAQKLSYATTALPTGKDPLDEFLFERRRGHCEFFASSFSLLLRIAGIPSRLVGGYYGGTYNELGGYYVITDDMAHVWVEAFLPGQGWVTVDPSTLASNFSGTRDRNRGVLDSISLTLDTLMYYWNMAVITYDLDRQLQLLNRANFEVKRLRLPGDLKGWLWLVMLPFLVVWGCFWIARRAGVSPEARLVASFFNKVRNEYGEEQVPAAGLLELAARLNDPDVTGFATIYCGAIYRGRVLTADEIRVLRQYIHQIHNRHPHA